MYQTHDADPYIYPKMKLSSIAITLTFFVIPVPAQSSTGTGICVACILTILTPAPLVSFRR
jgi:hypothetical protein